jgi:hypothetical protein
VNVDSIGSSGPPSLVQRYGAPARTAIVLNTKETIIAFRRLLQALPSATVHSITGAHFLQSLEGVRVGATR